MHGAAGCEICHLAKLFRSLYSYGKCPYTRLCGASVHAFRVQISCWATIVSKQGRNAIAAPHTAPFTLAREDWGRLPLAQRLGKRWTIDSDPPITNLAKTPATPENWYQVRSQGLRPDTFRRLSKRNQRTMGAAHSFLAICGQQLPCAIIERQETDAGTC